MTASVAAETPAALAPGPLQIRVDDAFRDVLVAHKCSLAFTVGPDGLVIMGTDNAKSIHVDHKYLQNGFAVACKGDRLAVSSRFGITVFNKSTRLAASHPVRPNLYDAYFSPLVTFHTGDCLVHDMAITKAGLVVANTRFSTVCLIDGRFNFNPIWSPAFISVPMPEDRCHLNGVVADDERLRYVTAFGPYDVKGGWRDGREFKGLLIDVEADKALVDDLIMPHSPRLINERLYVCESGHGAVLEIDRSTGQKRCLVKLPGLTRGLVTSQDVLFVGLSNFRSSVNRWELPVVQPGHPLLSGVAAVDLRSGKVIGMATILNPSREVLDVAVLPGMRCAGMSDIDSADDYKLIESPVGGYWIKSEAGKRVVTPHD